MPTQFTSIVLELNGVRSVRAHAGHMGSEEIAAYLEGVVNPIPGTQVSFWCIDLYSDVGDSIANQEWTYRNGAWVGPRRHSH